MHATTLILLLALPLAPLAAQKPERDPLLPPQVKKLNQALKARGFAEDTKVIGILEDFGKVARRELHPRDLRLLVRTLDAVLRRTRLRPPENVGIYRKAAEVLVHTGEPGAAVLAQAAELDRFDDREYDPLRAHFLEQLGRMAVPRHREFLLETARRSPRPRLMAAAGGALRHYTDAPLKAKREIVDELLVTWGSHESKASDPVAGGRNPEDFSVQNSREILRAIRADWLRTLQTLTGKKLVKFEDWQRWLNKNPDWRPPEKEGDGRKRKR